MKKVMIIGGGASGMAAAYASSLAGNETILIEKNEKLGKKLFITGKGRCNVTNDCDTEDLLKQVVSNSKFLYSSLYTWTNQNVKDLLEENGCLLKTERGNRVFPLSDRSSDVIRTWERILKQQNVEISLNTRIKKILLSEENKKQITGVILERNGKTEEVSCDSLILCTGGISYPSTGSSGDGHKLCEGLGIQVTELFPALVPLYTKEEIVKQLQGLSLRNVAISVRDGNKEVYSDFGEMLFTHFGVSGPIVLHASSYVTQILKDRELTLSIDLKPALSEKELDQRILRDFQEFKNKQFKNSLQHLLPGKLIPVILSLSGIPEEKKVNEISKEERKKLVQLLKGFQLTLIRPGSFQEAIITQGGISVSEIDASTMRCKQYENLYVAGELIDIDAMTGGYNLQLAWSTGYLAGINA